MNSNPKSTAARCLLVGAMVFLLVWIGPWLVHVGYRLATPASVKQSKTERYHHIANAETFDVSLSAAKRMKMRREREDLFHWFHARGWAIDEGDEEQTWLHPWQELIRYWNGPGR